MSVSPPRPDRTTSPPGPDRTTSPAVAQVPALSRVASVVGAVRGQRDLLAWVHEQRLRHGDVFAARLPRWLPGAPETIVYACEPAAVHEILTDPTRFVKRSPVWDELGARLGDGLLTSEGEAWRGQRRTLQPLFTRKRIAEYTDAFLAATEVVSDSWAGRPDVELGEEMERVTLGSVSRALFGTDVTDEVAPIVAATDELSRITVQRGVRPLRPPSWLTTPEDRRLDELEADLKARTQRLVDRAAAHAGGRDDLVARLLEARDPETGDHLSEREILEQALIFLLAGYDTTSTALAFTLHELGARPDLQALVRDEVLAVVGDGTPTAADVAALELTRRCLLEGMRLHPPAYITGRSATVDTTVAGYRVAAGTVLLTLFGELHRNERWWPDPDRFDPDRFLPEAVAARDHYAYLPFGGGPRSCIGEHFALLEATLALAVLLRRWQVRTSGAPVPMRFGITQRADAPLRAHLHPVGREVADRPR